MNQRSSETSNAVPQLNEKSFTEIVAAISDGKYSWACILMLRAAGYNPSHYLPLRTYKRIVKANRVSPAEAVSQASNAMKRTCKFSDIAHVKTAQASGHSVRGGFSPFSWFERMK